MDKITRLQRVETASRQLLSVAMAQTAQLDAKLRDLRDRRDAMSADVGVAPSSLSRHFARLHERLSRELQAVEDARKRNLLDVLHRKLTLEGWQGRLKQECALAQTAVDDAERSRIIEAMLAIRPAASLP